MKKKWLLSSLFATLGSGLAFSAARRFFRRPSSLEDQQREAITKLFESKGYTVHRYNSNNDFLLFNNRRNEKKHILYDNGQLPDSVLTDKLNAYFHHFTDEFYVIAQDESTLEQHTKPRFSQWAESLQGQPVRLLYTTAARVHGFDGESWESAGFSP